MQLREFKYQEKQTKQELLSCNGVYLAHRVEGDYIIFLYAIDSFYVEMYVDFEDSEIGYIRAFANTEFLQPYLREISLDALLSPC